MTEPDVDTIPPVVVFLHFLGGSARTWGTVARYLEGVARCIRVDLAGFGESHAAPGYALPEMADAVARQVVAAAPGRWLLVGHSMGAKVAAVLARRAEDGAPDLAGLSGMVLLAGSPPGPEPMAEERRQDMLGWFAGGADDSRRQADGFIRKSVSRTLDSALHDAAVDDVLRANPVAWRAWLASGSLEDCSSYVGMLAVPTVLVAGADDEDLGPDLQRLLAERHFTQARVVTVPEASHLLPLEWPELVAKLIAGHVAATAPSPFIGPGYRALIGSDRVSTQTRSLLMARARADDPAYQARAVAQDQLQCLRALLDRVLPQSPPAIDLAARIDAQLADGVGDGWRSADLPADAEAYRAGLRSLDALSGGAFADGDAHRQDALLRRVAAGEATAAGPGLLDAGQMQLWFADVRSDAVRLYVAHPATLARMGYSGIGYGGDGEPKPGFHSVGVGEREAWEPEPQLP